MSKYDELTRLTKLLGFPGINPNSIPVVSCNMDLFSDAIRAQHDLFFKEARRLFFGEEGARAIEEGRSSDDVCKMARHFCRGEAARP